MYDKNKYIIEKRGENKMKRCIAIPGIA